MKGLTWSKLQRINVRGSQSSQTIFHPPERWVNVLLVTWKSFDNPKWMHVKHTSIHTQQRLVLSVSTCWWWMSDKYKWCSINFIGSILVLGELNVKFQDFIALSVAFCSVLLIVGRNNIATYFCVMFLYGGLWNKIILDTARHTQLCSCQLWVVWPPKHAEMEVCRQFAKAVILVPVGFSYNLLLHFTDLAAFCFI